MSSVPGGYFQRAAEQNDPLRVSRLPRKFDFVARRIRQHALCLRHRVSSRSAPCWPLSSYTDSSWRPRYYGLPGETCTECPANTYRDMVNGTIVAACRSCPDNSISGTKSTSLSDCICEAGYYGNPGQGRACEPCPVGTYNALQNQTTLEACLSCPGNASTSDSAQSNISDCECNSGCSFALSPK